MMRYVRKTAVVSALILCSFVVVLLGHSKAKSTQQNRVPILSEENFTGAIRWWLFGAPFYLFVVLAPSKYFSGQDDEDVRS